MALEKEGGSWTKEKQKAYLKGYRIKNREKLNSLNRESRYRRKKPKKCRYCDNDFVSTISHFFYCSDTCRNASRKAQNKEFGKSPNRLAYLQVWNKSPKRLAYRKEYDSKRIKYKKCKYCHADFVTSKKLFYFCKEDCAIAYTKLYDQEYQKSPERKMWLKDYMSRPDVHERYMALSRGYRKTEHGRAKARYYGGTRRVRVLETVAGYTRKEFLDKIKATNGFCSGCNHPFSKDFRSKHELTLDHEPPVSKAPKGFVYTIDMISPLCRSCNSKKGNRGFSKV